MSTDDSDAGEDDAETATALSSQLEGVPTASEATVEKIRHRLRDGTFPFVGAAIAALLAVAARGRSRAVTTVAGLLGVGLATVGYRRRRSSDQQSNDEGTESETQYQTPDVSFTDDRSEPRSKPDLDDEATDPRSGEDITEPADDGKGVTIDISEPSMADEPGEATGPDPEQSQPTRTAAPEPETGGDPGDSDGDPASDVEGVRGAEADENDGADADESGGADTDGAMQEGSGESADESDDDSEGDDH